MPDPAFTFAKVPSTSVSSSTGVATCCFVNTTKPVFRKLQGENKLSWWSSLGELLGFLVVKQLGSTRGNTLAQIMKSVWIPRDKRKLHDFLYVVLLGYLVVGYSLDHHCNKVGWNSTDSIDLSYQFGVREPIAYWNGTHQHHVQRNCNGYGKWVKQRTPCWLKKKKLSIKFRQSLILPHGQSGCVGKMGWCWFPWPTPAIETNEPWWKKWWKKSLFLCTAVGKESWRQ